MDTVMGVRMVHALQGCAEVVQANNINQAENLLRQVRMLVDAMHPGPFRKVVTYFVDALARKLYMHNEPELPYSDITLNTHFSYASPYILYAHFAANDAIFNAFSGQRNVHIVDLGLQHGMQWPSLLYSLASRPGGPPELIKLTGIARPQLNNSDPLAEVGQILSQQATNAGLNFQFRQILVDSLADIDLSMLGLLQTESVAVNSVCELHRLFAQPGAFHRVLTLIRAMRPCIVTLVEPEANLNEPVFVERFTEALNYYASMFDSLESLTGITHDNIEGVEMSRIYLGRQISNVVACEGRERTERHETLSQWWTRMTSGGFRPVCFRPIVFQHARMMLQNIHGEAKHFVRDNQGCLMLGWDSRPLTATSAWKLS